MTQWVRLLLGVAALGSLACSREVSRGPRKLLDVSYDATRDLYRQIDGAFESQWLAQTGEQVVIEQSHGGSGRQARAILDGLGADVATLALAYDIDELHDRGNLLPADWQRRYSDHSCPYTSTVVFLVRAGNPRRIHGWDDLARPGVSVILPNPKTSGGARWSYLAAWGWASQAYGGDDPRVRAYMSALYHNTPVLAAGSRGASIAFGQSGIGDVLVAWEAEALLLRRELGSGAVEIVTPPSSILAEPPVAVVDRYADEHGTRDLAQAYLAFLYSPDAQELIARSFYRPRDPAALARHANLFPRVELFTVDGAFGGWRRAQREHFAEGGSFDQIYRAGH
ncbi:MAG: sulfate ABC transporter substrate-binding protein [Myxococcales bacterium]